MTVQQVLDIANRLPDADPTSVETDDLRTYVSNIIRSQGDLDQPVEWTLLGRPSSLPASLTVPPPEERNDGMRAVLALIGALVLVVIFVAWDPFDWFGDDDPVVVQTESSADDRIEEVLRDIFDDRDSTPSGGEQVAPVAPSGDRQQGSPSDSGPLGTFDLGSTGNGASGGSCQLDKVGTWSEGNAPHRIEVAGHGRQHLDVYPTPGVKSVSFVVPSIPDPEGVPDTFWGYGSLWEGNGAGCDSFDYKSDASHYAEARLDSGHSGLVVEWGTWRILENVGNLSGEQIDGLLSQFSGSIGDSASPSTSFNMQQEGAFGPSPSTQFGQTGSSGLTDADREFIAALVRELVGDQQVQSAPPAPVYSAPAPVAPAVQPRASAPAAPAASAPAPAPRTAPRAAAPARDCSPREVARHDPKKGSAWNLPQGTLLVTVWSNHHNPNTEEHTMLFPASEANRSLMSGGGVAYSYPQGCDGRALQDFSSKTNRINRGQYDHYIATGVRP